MSDKTIGVEESFAKWREDEDYRQAYDALEEDSPWLRL